jgi:hypothetical protein
MDGRKYNSGTIGNKGGRPPKEAEQLLIEKLQPLEPKALEALKNGLKDGKPWAVKLFFQYRFGLPKQTVDNTSTNITWIEEKTYSND